MSWELVTRLLGVLGGLGVLAKFAAWVWHKLFDEEPGRLLLGLLRDPNLTDLILTAEWAGQGRCWDVRVTGLQGALLASLDSPFAGHLGPGDCLNVPLVLTAHPASATVTFRPHSKKSRTLVIDLWTAEVRQTHGPRSWRATGVRR